MTTITCLSSGGGQRQIEPGSVLPPSGRDAVRVEANRWIKSLRLVPYGAETMRDRFRYRGDSLWWFTELYLHKMKRLDRAVETVSILDAVKEAEAPARLRVTSADVVVREAAEAFGRARGLDVEIDGAARVLSGTAWPSYLVGLTSRLSRLRQGSRPSEIGRTSVAAFVHTAFWRAPASRGPGGEGYIGPVLDALAKRSAEPLAYVGVGPRRNFRARRWWDPVTTASGTRPLIVPIERLAPRAALTGALALWKRRRTLAAELVAGDAIREASRFRGVDLWPVLGRELEAVALLQWPWSVRAMDEAAAALEALAPAVAVTYAEAGGWGRALVLEARRRGIASVGLQHGFIYRHWLNYLHEADEMAASSATPGFPAPTRTLLFDGLAADHLAAGGHFDPTSMQITGSARLDELTARLEAFRPERASLQRQFGIGAGEQLVILATKHSEIRDVLPALVAAVASLPGVRLVIKTHPAETPEVYASAIREASRVQVAPADADLARLLAAADGLVTRNSTVAIDGLVVGLPTLVIGLPSNLSPFVDAGVMRGAADAAGIAPELRALLYDQEARVAMGRLAARFAASHGMRADGGAADRAADRILEFVERER
jgi:hypothetical protein